MQAIAMEIALAPPDPHKPNMFRCAAPGYVSAFEIDGVIRVPGMARCIVGTK